jgi:hypothetical protein
MCNGCERLPLGSAYAPPSNASIGRRYLLLGARPLLGSPCWDSAERFGVACTAIRADLRLVPKLTYDGADCISTGRRSRVRADRREFLAGATSRAAARRG